MKKYIYLITILTILFFIYGCNSNNIDGAVQPVTGTDSEEKKVDNVDEVNLEEITQRKEELSNRLSDINPKALLPDKCTLGIGISCKDFEVTNSEITLLLENSLGHNLENIEISINSCNTNGKLDSLSNGKQKEVKLAECMNFDSENEGILSEEISLTYTGADTKLDHKMMGTIFAKKEGLEDETKKKAEEIKLEMAEIDKNLAKLNVNTDTQDGNSIEAVMEKYASAIEQGNLDLLLEVLVDEPANIEDGKKLIEADVKNFDFKIIESEEKQNGEIQATIQMSYIVIENGKTQTITDYPMTYIFKRENNILKIADWY